MIGKLVAASALSLAFLGSALGASPTGTAFEITNSDGSTSHVHFSEGGKYSAKFGEQSVDGSWTYDGSELCITVTMTVCNAWEEIAVGESVVTNQWSPDGAEQIIKRVK